MDFPKKCRHKVISNTIVYNFTGYILYCFDPQYINKEDVVAQEAGVTIYYMNSRHFNAIECDERN